MAEEGNPTTTQGVEAPPPYHSKQSSTESDAQDEQQARDVQASTIEGPSGDAAAPKEDSVQEPATASPTKKAAVAAGLLLEIWHERRVDLPL